jgi:hypothetical protein
VNLKLEEARGRGGRRRGKGDDYDGDDGGDNNINARNDNVVGMDNNGVDDYNGRCKDGEGGKREGKREEEEEGEEEGRGGSVDCVETSEFLEGRKVI